VQNDDMTRAPARTMALLQQWVDEFTALTTHTLVDIKVAVQDGGDGRDTGLVIVQLGNGGADMHMQPSALDNVDWEVTLTSHPGDLTLTPFQMSALAAEIAVASDLCAFLQFKSLEWDRMSGMHD
jgi:hypothetical protein